MENRVCDYCGKEFIPKMANQMYCCKNCGAYASRNRNADNVRDRRGKYTSVVGKSLAEWCNENGERERPEVNS